MRRNRSLKIPGLLLLATVTTSCVDADPCASATPAMRGTISLNSCPLQVELAVSPAQIACGLMNRDMLAEDAGMLFVLKKRREIAFWMKNTRIPLDIAYLDSAGRILAINRGVALDQTLIPAPPGTAFALETNPGKLAQCGLGPGGMVGLSG